MSPHLDDHLSSMGWVLVLLVLATTTACDRDRDAAERSSDDPTQVVVPVPAGVGFTPSSVTAEPVTVEVAPPPVGLRRVEKTVNEMELDLSGQGGDVGHMRHYGIVARDTEVLATNARTASHVRVTYRIHGAEQQLGDAPAEVETAPVEGHTYLVDARGDDLVVTRADGAIPSAAELEIVRGDHDTLGQLSPFSRALPDGPLTPGQAVELSPDAIETIFATDPSFRLDDLEVIYRGTTDFTGPRSAVFEVSMTLDGNDAPGMQLRVELVGYVFIDPQTARRVGALLTGDVALQGDDGTAVGRGRMEFVAETRDTAPQTGGEQ